MTRTRSTSTAAEVEVHEFPPELEDVVDEGVEPDEHGELHLAPPDEELTEPELRAMHVVAGSW